jgi:hypothetical protein
LINKGKQQYRCNTVRIESQAGFWNFECNEGIKFPKHTVELTVANMVTYEINVKTSSTEDSGTSMPVYISILGTSGMSPKKLLSERGFETGSFTPIKIETKEIEGLYGINLYLIGNDNWIPEEIIIRKPVGAGCEENIFRNVNGLELNSPDKVLTLKLPKMDGGNDESVLDKGNANSLLDNKDLQSS